MPWGYHFLTHNTPCTPFSREIIDFLSLKSQFYSKKVNKRQINRLLIEDFPGPNKLPTRSIFDLKLALSFNCQIRVCCCFITTKCSLTSLLFRYGYIGH
jgi:hypothetical protein